jgi:hypothetical protein
MRCPEVRDLLHPFLDGELDVDRNVSMLKHLELCPPCRARSELEQTLRGAVVKACCEALPPERCRAMLDAACCPEQAAVAAPRRRLLNLRRFAIAATVLVAAGAGAVYLHVPCRWSDCRTRKVLALARETALMETPRRLEDLACGQGVCPPKLGGGYLRFEGAYVVRVNASEVPLLRYKCPEGKEVDLIRVPNAHVHEWDFQVLDDGRRYVVVNDGSSALIGWVDERDGTLWCVIGCRKSVPRERLELVASATLRDYGPN